VSVLTPVAPEMTKQYVTSSLARNEGRTGLSLQGWRLYLSRLRPGVPSRGSAIKRKVLVMLRLNVHRCVMVFAGSRRASSAVWNAV
jgi:hypothetical protein